MPVTGLRGRQVLDGDITRSDVNTSTSGSALITKLIAGTNISITSTGADAGTGDVTISATGTGLNGTGFVRMAGTTPSYITGTSSQFVKGDGSLDSNTYLTGNQTITLTGNVTGSGTTSIATTIANGVVTNAMLVNSSFNIGTTSISLGRASAAQTLTGVSIDGTAKYLQNNYIATDANLIWQSGVYTFFNGTNVPGGDFGMISIPTWGSTDGSSRYNLQIGSNISGNPVFRTTNINGAGTWYTFWHSGNLTNLNQLTNGPGYITSSGSISGSAGSATQVVTLQDSPPSGVNGQLWFETDTLRLKVYSSAASAWIDSFPMPDMALYYTKAGGAITGSVVIQQDLTVNGQISADGILKMNTTGTSYIRMGRFPASTTNSGEAWIGRASDRSSGIMTVQLGGGSNGSFFEIVDHAWSTVTFKAGMNDFSYKGNTIWHAGNLTNLNQLTNGPGYITGNQSITVSGDASGSGTTAISLTLATVNSNIGTFNNVTVNAKGLVTAASNISYLTGNQTITLTGDVTGSGTTSIATTIGAGKVTNAMLVNSSFNIGTTSISLGRASASQSLTGVSIDGSAGSVAWTNVTGRPTALSSFTNDIVARTTLNASSDFQYGGQDLANNNFSLSGATTDTDQFGRYYYSGTSGSFWSRYLPVDKSGKYRMKIRWKASAASGTYIAVILLDTNGNNINGAGTYWAYPWSGSGAPTSWTTNEYWYDGSSFPSNAAYVAFGISHTNYGGGSATYYVSQLEIERYSDQIAGNAIINAGGSYANPSWITSLAWSKITGAPAFITSYTETDTLATVTGRGASTSSAVTLNNTLTVGGASVYTYMWNDGSGTYLEAVGNTTATRKIRIQGNNGSGSYAQWFIDGGNGQIYGAAGGVTNFLMDSSVVYLRQGGSDKFWTGSDGTRNAGWLYMQNGGNGIHYPGYNSHFYMAGGAYWHMNPTEGLGYGGLILYSNYNGTSGGSTYRKGYLYYDTNGFGLLGGGDANWAISVNSSTSKYVTIGGDQSNNAYNAVTGVRLMFGGGNSDAQGNYYIGTNLNNYGGNYNKLDLAWHTGIRIGAQTGYGGIRMYADEDFSSLIFSVGEGDSNVRVTNNLFMGGNLVATQSWVTSQGYINSAANWFGAITTGGTTNWNDVSNTRPGTGYTLLLGNHSNGPGPGNYYHAFNLEYASKDGTGNVTQLAISYGTPGDDIKMRGRYAGTWTSWITFLNSSNYNSYSPTLTGGGASGTWGINITGSASSASTATSATQVVTIQDAPPSGANGKLWWESDTGRLKVYYSAASAWVDATAIPDMSLYYPKAGGSITGDVTVQQTLNVIGNVLIQGTLTETSDVSLKENILPLQGSLDKVMKLTGVSFNKKATPEVKEIGFIAQEVEAVIPDLVTETDNGIKTVSYSRVTAILVETVKEQQAQISELKNLVDKLTDKLNN